MLLHGFTGSGAAMAGLAAQLPRHRVVAPDLPGHGTNAAASAGFTDAVAQVLAIPGQLVLVGYSMGGRVALAAAVDHPERIDRLALIGASPGLADPGDRAERRRADAELAAGLRSRGVEWFVDRWMAQPMFAHQGDDERRQRLANDAEGLAASLEGMGTGSMPSLWGELHRVTCPVVLLVGGRDAKFAAIAAAMATELPTAAVHTIPDAGHPVHTDAPDATAAVLRQFLCASST